MNKKKAVSIIVPGRHIPDRLIAPVGSFLQHLTDSGRSPATVSKRQGDLLCLQHFLCVQGIDSYQSVSPATLQAFLTCLQDHDYSAHSVESAGASFRCFFAWLEDQGILFENPAFRVEIPYHSKHRIGLVLTEAQVARLLSQPDLTTPIGLRDRAVLELLYATGIRLSECAGLSIFDLDLTGGAVKVKGKGRKQRLLPLGRHAAAYLQRYLQHSRDRLLTRVRAHKDTHALWLTRTGAPLGKQSIRRLIKHHAQAADLPPETDTHTLRRTCASHLLRGGAHPIMVSQLLGHADLKTLSHYLKTTITDLMKTHAKTRPGK